MVIRTLIYISVVTQEECDKLSTRYAKDDHMQYSLMGRER